jgi:hypothetical protein
VGCQAGRCSARSTERDLQITAAGVRRLGSTPRRRSAAGNSAGVAERAHETPAPTAALEVPDRSVMEERLIPVLLNDLRR